MLDVDVVPVSIGAVVDVVVASAVVDVVVASTVVDVVAMSDATVVDVIVPEHDTSGAVFGALVGSSRRPLAALVGTVTAAAGITGTIAAIANRSTGALAATFTPAATVTGTITGAANRATAVIAATFTAAPATTGTITATANRPTATIDALFAPAGVVGGIIDGTAQRAVAAITGTSTPPPAVTGVVTASSNRQTAALAGTFAAAPAVTGAITGAGNRSTATINATFTAAPAVTGTLTASAKRSTAVINATVTSGSGALYTDNFDRANSTLTTPWVNEEGSHSIVSNKVAVGPLSPNVSYYNQTVAADQWAEADIAGLIYNGTMLFPAARITPGGDFYYFWLTGPNVSIYRRVGGTYTQVGSNGPTAGTALKARLEIQGTTLRAYADGVLMVTATDTSIATGFPGLVSANGSGATLDNWRGGNLPYTP